MHRKIPDQNRITTIFFHSLALETNRGKFRSIEKIRAPQMIIPSLDSGVDAFGLNGAGSLGDSVSFQNDRPGKLVKLAVHSIDHHMGHREPNSGVSGIDVVSVRRPRADPG